MKTLLLVTALLVMFSAANADDESAGKVWDRAIPKLAPVKPHAQILFFTATWCEPCQLLKRNDVPWLEKSGWRCDYSEFANLRYVDVDESPEMVKRFQIQAYPTLVLMLDGLEIDRKTYYGRATFNDLYKKLPRERLQKNDVKPMPKNVSVAEKLTRGSMK